jgi:pentatricopeptide repeat protein
MIAKPAITMAATTKLIPAAKTAMEAMALFRQIKNPDIVAYNNLMNFYTKQGNVTAAHAVFKQIATPDLVSYSTLIKTFVLANELDSAFSVLKKMKDAQIKPNAITFTNLIKGCVKAKDWNRAWLTFDHMRSHIQEPDAKSYALMIHACAFTQDAEKALDLLHEMSSRNIDIDNVTLTSVIQSLGSRSDYYPKVFETFDLIKEKGLKIEPQTFSVLLSSIANNNDIFHARKLWNQIVSDGSTPVCYENIKAMLRVYSGALHLFGKGYRWDHINNKLSNKLKDSALGASNAPDSPKPLQQQEIQFQLQVTPDILSTQNSISNPLNAPKNSSCNTLLVPDIEFVNNLPKFNTKTFSTLSTLDEAREIWLLAERMHRDKQLVIDQNLLNQNLFFLCSIPRKDAHLKALNFFESFATYNQEHCGKSFKYILEMLCKNKQEFHDKALPIWDRFLKWDAEKESRMHKTPNRFKKNISDNILASEKEILRRDESRHVDIMKSCFLAVSKGYARLGNVEKAIATLEEAQTFREPMYLGTFKLNDIGTLVDLAKRKADNGEWSYLRRLKETCPDPKLGNLAKVHHLLKKKAVGASWWGWDVLDIPNSQKRQIINNRPKS